MQHLPKALAIKLARRNSARIIKELEARQRMLKGASRDVFSTQSKAVAEREQQKNKGCCPSSADVRTCNPFVQNHGSNRTRFYSVGGRTISHQKATARVVRS